DDREPSLSIRDGKDGKVLLHCHAGCSQESVIAALRQRGLWPANGSKRSAGSAGSAMDRGDPERSRSPLRSWQSAKSAEDTEVERSLASRGLHLPPLPRLRFHPRLKHPSGSSWPAMVALVTRGLDDTPLAIHRTFLAHDGRNKAPLHPQKMMLGPCRGGAV